MGLSAQKPQIFLAFFGKTGLSFENFSLKGSQVEFRGDPHAGYLWINDHFKSRER